MDKDSSYLNRFCFGKGRRSGCNGSTRSLRSSSHPGPWWTSAADLDFCWNFFDNEGNGAETRRVTTSVGTRELRVPRARVRDEETRETTEFRSELLPRYARRTREVDEAILGTYYSRLKDSGLPS